MESCLIICGISGNGKTFAGRLLSSKLKIIEIEFDHVINFITEMTRIKIGESDPNFNFRNWFIQRLPFDDEEDFIAFKNACDGLISRNIDFFKKFYNELIINKKSTMYYKTEDHKLCVDLGKNGEFLESLGDEIMDLVIRYLIKQNESIILEGFSLKEGPYRKAIENICQNVNYLECHYKDKKNEFIYNLNGNGIKDIIDLENSVKKSLKSKRQAYQKFSSKQLIGDSKSFEKLENLGIPKKLENKSVLDLGCNEGFYCFECERRGARCVGIEKDLYWYNQALKRKNEFGSFVNFINQSWDQLPTINYKFDIVIFLAAFHYIKDSQLEVLTNVYNKLKNEGMLILEIGILGKNEGEFLVENVKRPAGDICQFTNKFTIEKLLHDAGFDEIQYHGTGWDIRGDDIPRYVIHALKTKNPKKENISELPKISQEEQKERIEIPFSSKEIGEIIIKAYKQNAFYRAIIKIGYKILNKKNSK